MNEDCIRGYRSVDTTRNEDHYIIFIPCSDFSFPIFSIRIPDTYCHKAYYIPPIHPYCFFPLLFHYVFFLTWEPEFEPAYDGRAVRWMHHTRVCLEYTLDIHDGVKVQKRNIITVFLESVYSTKILHHLYETMQTTFDINSGPLL